jgi:Leucine-rich repeat (LRR) protein
LDLSGNKLEDLSTAAVVPTKQAADQQQEHQHAQCQHTQEVFADESGPGTVTIEEVVLFPAVPPFPSALQSPAGSKRMIPPIADGSSRQMCKPLINEVVTVSTPQSCSPAASMTEAKGMSQLPLQATQLAKLTIASESEDHVLPELCCLVLSHNHLRQLPSWCPPSLTRLEAGSNRLHSVSGALCRQLAGNLKVLGLQDNLLEELPQELKFMSCLQLLKLGDNPGLKSDLPGLGLSWAYKWIAGQKATTKCGAAADN